MENIEITIKELIKSVIQFYNDMENDNPEGLNSFLNIFPSKLELFNDLMNSLPPSEVERYLYFKHDIFNVYDYLFKSYNISLIAEKYISGGVIGSIHAHTNNLNPIFALSALSGNIKKSVSSHPYEDFVKKYSHLFNGENKPEIKPKSKQKEIQTTTLKEACDVIHPESYTSLIGWFESKGLIDSDTKYWIDQKHGSIAILTGYLKALHSLGYTKVLHTKDILSIIRTSFNMEVGDTSTDHIKADKESKIPRFSK